MSIDCGLSVHVPMPELVYFEAILSYLLSQRVLLFCPNIFFTAAIDKCMEDSKGTENNVANTILDNELTSKKALVCKKAPMYDEDCFPYHIRTWRTEHNLFIFHYSLSLSLLSLFLLFM